MNRKWIIGICSSECNGVRICMFIGTNTEVKEKLVQLVLGDKANDENCWIQGSESIEDVEDVSGIGCEFCAYGSYSDYQIEYTAKEFSHIAKL